MKPTPLYVSFYTDRYADSAAELRGTLEQFGLEHVVAHQPGAGNDWLVNVQRKPGFIRNMMRRHPGRPLVWLDADARVRKRPALFAELAAEPGGGVDFAAHWLGGRGAGELLSGTLYFGPTDAAYKLAVAWSEEQAACRDLVDQIVLERLLRVGRGPEALRVAELPASYTAIFDHPMCPPGERVIEHLQHSRRFRDAS